MLNSAIYVRDSHRVLEDKNFSQYCNYLNGQYEPSTGYPDVFVTINANTEFMDVSHCRYPDGLSNVDANCNKVTFPPAARFCPCIGPCIEVATSIPTTVPTLAATCSNWILGSKKLFINHIMYSN
jgi:hypothetical protein